MFRIFYAAKDTTLYEAYPDYNTGVDEILEVGKRLSYDGDSLLKSRCLVKFDLSEVTAALSKYSKTVNDCKFVLQLYTSHAKNLPENYTIVANLTGENWVNGTGFLSNLTVDGASWSGSMSGSFWISGSQNVPVGSSTLYITGSGAGGSWMYQNNPVGTTVGLTTSQSFALQTTDLSMDVTDAIKTWINGNDAQAVPNYGFLLRFSDADEANNNVKGFIRFFSRETHTIYVPKLTMYFDNSTFTTGSLTSANLDSYAVYTKVKPTYKDTEVAKIRVYVRDKFPRKSPTNLFPIETVKYLPTSSYYSISDAATDEVIIPFDNIYTKLSCDSTSNFIYVDMNGFMPERYYRLNLKIVDGFVEQYIDDEIYFKVVR